MKSAHGHGDVRCHRREMAHHDGGGCWRRDGYLWSFRPSPTELPVPPRRSGEACQNTTGISVASANCPELTGVTAKCSSLSSEPSTVTTRRWGMFGNRPAMIRAAWLAAVRCWASSTNRPISCSGHQHQNSPVAKCAGRSGFAKQKKRRNAWRRAAQTVDHRSGPISGML